MSGKSLYSTNGTNSCVNSAATNSQQKRTVYGVTNNIPTMSYQVAAQAVCGCTNTQVYENTQIYGYMATGSGPAGLDAGATGTYVITSDSNDIDKFQVGVSISINSSSNNVENILKIIATTTIMNTNITCVLQNTTTDTEYWNVNDKVTIIPPS